MKRLLKYFVISLISLGILSSIGFIYYKNKYPYGYTHRCSKGLAMDLHFHANENEGNFPNFVDGDKLMVADFIGDSDAMLELLIGKTVNFEEAKAFYTEHGYLLTKHSAWHFVNGVNTSHTGRAFAWDKIPLGHNGQMEDSKSREVIEVDGMVSNISQDQWDEYLNKQQSTEWSKDSKIKKEE